MPVKICHTDRLYPLFQKPVGCAVPARVVEGVHWMPMDVRGKQRFDAARGRSQSAPVYCIQDPRISRASPIIKPFRA